MNITGVDIDLEYALKFLCSYNGSAATFNSYRREIERLLQWVWRIEKSESDMHSWEENRQFTYQVQYEDLEIYESIQKGFQSNYTQPLIFGTQEEALHAYAKNIDKQVRENIE